ncbi:conserved protein of unknown function [Rhodovastum atsumiense]|uniref:Uncharacterized protein n=1 Tax=Rhodovastum atsumiense TaxID=504468 RepID=A0A5M6IQ45_9PROT|nr:hypothetical protein [Rhodovastum atsumiense]KAA5610039.1 hypothetical protein F1189_21280 [Rhodovastum atsumiense]CAH2602969.1 conserved protein of unknown function [Rhodovastum atsumiense]
MPSSTSSSERAWRRFWRTLLATAGGAAALAWLFIMGVDPYGNLPLSLPWFDRGPVDGNARYAFPALARDPRFDSALFGTSTSRLLRPAALNPVFGARFANLSMNSATSYEQARLLALFLRHHPRPRVIAIGLDREWCVTPPVDARYTFRRFPEWLYDESWPGRWGDYQHMFDMYTLEKAGQAFAQWTGLAPRVYGRDGYTRFVPPDAQYDRARAAVRLREALPWDMPKDDAAAPASWALPGVDRLRAALAAVPERTLKLLFFVPYNHRLIAQAPGPALALQTECKRRVAALGRSLPNLAVVDFMIPGPITLDDDNYWDPHHYRNGIAERIVADLAGALRGEATPDAAILVLPRSEDPALPRHGPDGGNASSP